ncbi:MAG: beta-glucosidase, partial [Eubacteriales bacterium]
KELTLDLSGINTDKGTNYSFALTVNNPGYYKVTLTASSTQSELAQIPVTLFVMGTASGTFTWNGTGGEPVSFTTEIPMFSHFTAFRLYFAQSGLDMKNINFTITGREVSIDSL